jgi:predicted Zn-dependent protease
MISKCADDRERAEMPLPLHLPFSRNRQLSATMPMYSPSARASAFSLTRVLRLVLGSIIALCLMVQPVLAQSILRDAETEAFMAEISEPIIRAADLNPRNVGIYLIHDRSINAFTAGGQDVYFHTGLITAADNANEVQGVMAHELGHVAGGHVLRISEGAKVATGISILSLVLAAAAIAAGAGDAGAGILAAGQQAAFSKFLAYSRTQEATADAAAQTYLTSTGISGQGMISFFKKLQNLEFRYGLSSKDDFGTSHPLSGDRIAILREKFTDDPAWNKKNDAAVEARFQRIKAKLKGFVNEPRQTLLDYPESNTTLPARYARAYAWHRSAYPEKALAEVDALLKAAPVDPYYLELKGQILLESGRPTEALPLLRQAVNATNAQPLIATLFGHALMATDDAKHTDEAARVLKSAVTKDKDNPFAWFVLGTIYERSGDTPRAALASAEGFYLQGRSQQALASARAAMSGIPKETPDWIRAQDIELVAKANLEDEKRRKR